MISLRGGWQNKQEDDKIRRFSLRQSEARLERPLLTVWRLKGEHLLTIDSQGPEVFWAKPDTLNSLFLFELGKVNGRQIVRFSPTAFVFELSLQARNLFSVVGSHKIRKSSRLDGMHSDRLAKAVTGLGELHIHGEICTGGLECRRHPWIVRQRYPVHVRI